MKHLNKIAAAVAGLTLAGQAAALTPADSVDIEIFISGASAQDNNIEALASDLCVANTLDVYYDTANPAKPGAAYRAFFCEVNAAEVPGLGANANMLIYKRSAGGSGQGVMPVVNGDLMDRMTIFNSNCTNTAGNEWECSVGNAGDIVQAVPDAGISDVEPSMFKLANAPSGVDPADDTKINSRAEVYPTAGLMFGIPVTPQLRDALQVAQGLTPGSETEADMPTLTREQVASLFTARVQKWSKFTVNGTALTAYPGVTPPTDTKVRICRRTNGSGTQAQFNAQFLGHACGPHGYTPASAPGNPILGPIITEGSGSGNVTTCLVDHEAAGNWAAGIQSLEKGIAAKPGETYRFVKIDGYAPTLENVVKGKYWNWSENTIQWRKPAFNGPDADQLPILQTIRDRAASPARVASANTGFVHGFGVGAYLALATSGHTPNPIGQFDAANPVTPYTHAASGTPRTCATAVINANAVTGM